MGKHDFKYIPTTFQLNETNWSLSKKADMQFARRHHTLGLMGKHIYCIGGENGTNGVLKTCEKYDIEADSWEKIPSLNHPKCRASLCSFNDCILYAFGGTYKEGNTEDYFDSIELYSNRSGTPKWENILVTETATWTKRASSGSIQIDEDSILLFGGKDIKTRDDVLIFKASNNSFQNGGKLPNPEIFQQRQVTRFQNKIFTIGKFGNEILSYSITNLNWERISRQNWHPIQYKN